MSSLSREVERNAIRILRQRYNARRKPGSGKMSWAMAQERWKGKISMVAGDTTAPKSRKSKSIKAVKA